MFRVALITVGDKTACDTIRLKLRENLFEDFEGEEVYYKNLKGDFGTLQEELFNITEKGLADLVLTTGGTGFARKNITPEATMAVIEKEIPGIMEMMRQKASDRYPNVALSRGRAGIRKSTLIINLPDREDEILESLKVLLSIIPQGIDALKKDYTNHKYHELRLW